MGQPHSIVRHADMPKTAFQALWETLRSKQIWQGYVRNRVKGGGCYWVRATVFPCLDHLGAITGFISIRTKPSPIEAIEASCSRSTESSNRNSSAHKKSSITPA